jgi:hypothetical protein
MTTTVGSPSTPRSWRVVLAAFLPIGTEAAPLIPAAGERPPLRAQCRRGEHVWVPPELSLRSARTGFEVQFCRYCMAHERLVPTRTTQPTRVVRLPVLR